jgi:nicotinamidase-related amidase
VNYCASDGCTASAAASAAQSGFNPMLRNAASSDWEKTITFVSVFHSSESLSAFQNSIV